MVNPKHMVKHGARQDILDTVLQVGIFVDMIIGAVPVMSAMNIVDDLTMLKFTIIIYVEWIRNAN